MIVYQDLLLEVKNKKQLKITNLAFLLENHFDINSKLLNELILKNLLEYPNNAYLFMKNLLLQIKHTKEKHV